MMEYRVRANQIELQVREYERDAEAVVFLHFSGANLLIWERIVPHFQGRYRLVLVDLRGHGRSDRPESGYHADEMAGDVLAILHHAGIAGAHIVGSSLGAEVGLSLAANHPERVLSLVCDGALSSEYGPYGTWEGSEQEFEEHVARQLERMQNRPETVFPSIDALVSRRREVLEGCGWWNEQVEAVERYGACQVGEGQYTAGLRKQAMLGYMRHYFHYRFEDYYRRVRCPVLMVHGEGQLDERETSAMEGLSTLAQQATIVRVAGWVHPCGWLLQPDDMSRVLLRFLDREQRPAD